MSGPMVVLRNEHETLISQLELLERQIDLGEDILALLRTLERDSAVHFRREDVLLRALSFRLGRHGQQLNVLVTEHDSFIREIGSLIELMSKKTEPRSPHFSGRVRKILHELTAKFRAHIRHEEMVIYRLAESRLSLEHRQSLGQQILAL